MHQNSFKTRSKLPFSALKRSKRRKSSFFCKSCPKFGFSKCLDQTFGQNSQTNSVPWLNLSFDAARGSKNAENIWFVLHFEGNCQDRVMYFLSEWVVCNSVHRRSFCVQRSNSWTLSEPIRRKSMKWCFSNFPSVSRGWILDLKIGKHQRSQTKSFLCVRIWFSSRKSEGKSELVPFCYVRSWIEVGWVSYSTISAYLWIWVPPSDPVLRLSGGDPNSREGSSIIRLLLV